MFLHQRLPNNFSFTNFTLHKRDDKYLEVKKLWVAGIYSLITPCSHQIFSHYGFVKITLVFTTQIQSSYKIKRDDLLQFYVLYLSGPLKLCVTRDNLMCYTFWSGRLDMHVILGNIINTLVDLIIAREIPKFYGVILKNID